MQIRPDGLDVCAPMADTLVFHICNMACAIRILGHAKATENTTKFHDSNQKVG